MQIRSAIDSDLPELLHLFAEHAVFEKAPPPDGNVADLAKALFAQPPALYIWVVADEEKIYGFASAALEYSTWRTRTYFHLDCLYLQREIRGQGWGRCLMAEVQEKALLLGCEELQWQTPQWNEPAQKFYKRLGASVTTKCRFSLKIKA